MAKTVEVVMRVGKRVKERMTAREKEHSGSASTITNGPPAGASAILGVRSAPVLSCCCAASMVPLLSPAPERTLSNPHQVQERKTETE